MPEPRRSPTPAAHRPGAGAAFADRHIGPDELEQAKMLAVLGFDSLDELVAEAVPAAIRLAEPLDLPDRRVRDRGCGAELRGPGRAQPRSSRR